MLETSSIYRPRQPQDLKYYQCIEEHFERFEQVYDDLFTRQHGFFPLVRGDITSAGDVLEVWAKGWLRYKQMRLCPNQNLDRFGLRP